MILMLYTMKYQVEYASGFVKYKYISYGDLFSIFW